MLWDAALISRLLELYRENRVLWDQKHNNYSDKTTMQMALEGIQEELDIPVAPKDIHRKYRTMRAAYQVEVRNIHAAKLRGFFYKPTLHWFDIFHKFEQDTKAMKEQSVVALEMQHNKPADPKKYSAHNEDRETPRHRASNKVVRHRPPVHLYEDSRESSEMEYSSEESEDEFQTFADHVAEQLRNISVHRAVMIQNQIQKLFARDKEMHEEEF